MIHIEILKCSKNYIEKKRGNSYINTNRMGISFSMAREKSLFQKMLCSIIQENFFLNTSVEQKSAIRDFRDMDPL